MKKMMAAILAAAMTLTAFAGCGSKPAEPQTSSNSPASTASGEKTALDEIKERGELIMYTNAAFPPFEYVSNNEVVGVDADIAQLIADEIGVKLKIEDVAFDSIIESVKSGKADMGAAGMTIRPDRLEQVDFSIEYVTSVQYLILPEGSEIKTMEDLAGKAVGVQLGTTGDIMLDEELGDDGVLNGTGTQNVQYKNAIEATMDMKNGRLDAVIIDKMPAQSIVANNDGLVCYELVYEDGSSTEEQYGIAIAKGNDDLMEVINKVLQKLMDEGEVDNLILKHSEKGSE